MMAIVACWRCEAPGHVAGECSRPAPKDRKQLEKRVARYVERWMSGAISTAQKRTWIEMENKAYRKEMVK